MTEYFRGKGVPYDLLSAHKPRFWKCLWNRCTSFWYFCCVLSLFKTYVLARASEDILANASIAGPYKGTLDQIGAELIRSMNGFIVQHLLKGASRYHSGQGTYGIVVQFLCCMNGVIT